MIRSILLVFMFLFQALAFAESIICQVTTEFLPPFPEIVVENKEGKISGMKERHFRNPETPPQFIEFDEFTETFAKDKKWPLGDFTGKVKESGYKGTLKVQKTEKNPDEDSKEKEFFKAEYSRTTSKGALKKYPALCTFTRE